MDKNSDIIKDDFMKKVKVFLEKEGEEVLLVKSGTFSIPWCKEEEEGYINLTFSIPKGARDGEGYDGYEEAENYAFQVEEKRKRREEQTKKKEKKKIEDQKKREEAKRIKEEIKKKRKGEEAEK